ncbi:unnamed protein product [Caenorhabditis angaria]|uniref:Uncharacterized protein n=1 Tax=Caenorhabditis angaria TaxID=860376 RepID=A0A9P1IEN3_9PELO|nr:unnamed protein product [Caenorhabditis angaria]
MLVSMSVDIRKMVKDKLFKDVIRLDNKRKILVVDNDGMRVLSDCFKMSELFEEKIILIEDLFKRREKIKNIDALYLVKPTENVINIMISDFKLIQKSKKKFKEDLMYKSANIYFLSQCSDSCLEQLSANHIVKYIKTLKEMNLSFKPIQSHVFGVDQLETSLGIASFCLNLGIYPFLRFHSDFAQSAEFCYRIEQNLDEFMKTDLSLGIESDSHLLILDRSFDLLTPLLHELTFEAMISENEEELEKLQQNDEDEIWNEVRHLHIAEVIDRIHGKMKNTKKIEVFGTIREFGKTMKNIKNMEKLEKYITLTEKLLESYKTDLIDIITLEQDMSTGFTSENVPIRDGRIVQNLTKILMDKNVSENYRLRLILIYMLCLPEKIEDYYLKMVEVSGFSDDGIDVVRNMLQLYKSSQPCMMPRRKLPSEYQFNTSRWIPHICDIIKSVHDGSLDTERFRCLGKQPSRKTAVSSARFGSLENRANKKIVIFIAGGITYSEIREAYKFSNTLKNTQIFIGSDRILTPNNFIEHYLRNKF